MKWSRYLSAIVFVLSCWYLAPRLCAQDAAYLSLEPGSQWELHSSSVGQPMLFTVEGGRSGRVDAPVRVAWQNPWMQATFIFRSVGPKVLLDGLDTGHGVAPMPSATVYFDFSARSGTRWANSLGRFEVAKSDVVVKTPAGVFSHCIEIVVTDTHGAKTFWFFAPGRGFVQFGEGSSAFLLTSYRKVGDAKATPKMAEQPVPSPVGNPVRTAEGGLYLGLESNPAPAQGYSFAAKQQSHAMSAKFGSRLIFVGPKWEEVEPSPGQYNFVDIDDRVALARQTGGVVLLNLRLIDSTRSTVPQAYRGWAWDDPRLHEKLVNLLRAMAPHLAGRTRWIAVGNEVDSYLPQHKNEIAPYARMFASLAPDLHQYFPNVPLTVNFTASAVHDLTGKYQAIVEHTDVDSINFYPINADFTFRDPASSGNELQTIIDSATGRPIIFQEMGYPSSTKLGSSEEKQAQFLLSVLRVLAANRKRVQACSFNWRSDLPNETVRELTGYYKLGKSDNFREFLASLGWFHQDGSPKKIWQVFEAQAPLFLPGS